MPGLAEVSSEFLRPVVPQRSSLLLSPSPFSLPLLVLQKLMQSPDWRKQAGQSGAGLCLVFKPCASVSSLAGLKWSLGMARLLK